MEVGITNFNNTINASSQSTVEVQKLIKASPAESKDTSKKNEVKINQQELSSSIDRANKLLFKNNTHLKFQIHQKTKEVMVKIINDESGEVLKEIPPEKMLDMVAKLWEIAGILVDEKR
jgi:flagellar protein FlaG